MPFAAGRPAQRASLRRSGVAPAALAVAIAALLGAPRAAEAQCPPNRPFMCPMGSCVGTRYDCASVEGCPPFAPHRCVGGLCAPGPGSCDLGATPSTIWFGPPEQEAGAPAAEPVDDEPVVADDDAVTAPPVFADLAEGLACPDEQPVGCEQDVCCPLDHPWCCGNGTCGADDTCSELAGGIPAVLAMTPADPAAAGLEALRLDGAGVDDTGVDDTELEDTDLDDAGVDDAGLDDTGARGVGDEDEDDAIGAGDADDDGFAFTGGIDDAAWALLARREAQREAQREAPVGAVSTADEGMEAAAGCDPSTPSAARASTATTVALSAAALGLFVATLARMRKKRREGRRWAVARS